MKKIFSVVCLSAAAFAQAYEYGENFTLVDPRGGSYGIDIERNSLLSHEHGWVEDGIYRIPVNGNRHFLATPALGDFRLEADYELVRFHRFDFTLGYVVFFRYDREARKGNRLEIFYDRFLKLHIAVDGKDVYTRQDADPIKLDGLKLVFEATGNRGRVRTLGADVAFDIPEGPAPRGAVGFDLTINEGVKILISRLRLVSPENPAAETVGTWRFALSQEQGFVAPAVYDVTLKRYATGGNELVCRLSGLLPDRPKRTETGGREWTTMAERLYDPYLKLTGADGVERVFYLWNGRRQFADPKMRGRPAEWPVERSYFIRELPEDFTLAAGYARAIVHPWRFAANGPWEQVRAKSGALIHEGQALGPGRIAFRATSPADKKIVSRIPADLPERARALKHAREQNYFFASEKPRFSIETIWRAADYRAEEIDAVPRLETVYGDRTGVAFKPVGAPVDSDPGAGLRRRVRLYELEKNPGVGVWHVETDVGAGAAGNTRTERTVFEVLSDDPEGPCPPLASGLPELVSMPNEIKYLEESAFDPWSARGGVSHYYSIDMRYPAIGDKLQVWRGDHLYRRKYWTWLTKRNTGDIDPDSPGNRRRMLTADYVCTYPLGKHREGRFDFAQTKFYTRYQLTILEDYIREKGLKLKLLTPERLAEVRKAGRGVTGAELKEVFDACWDDFKVYAKRRVDEYMRRFTDGLLAHNPKLGRGSYGPMPVYTAHYKSPYTLEYNSHPVETDPRLRENGSFWLFEDYHYSCDYPVYRPAYFVAAYSLMHPQGRRIFPEIYYEGWGRCNDGAVYQAHPDKYPSLAKTHQRRIAYQFTYGTPFLRNDGTFGFWTDYGFHARNPEKEAMDEFLHAWGRMVKNRPAAPFKAPYVIVDRDAFRRHGDYYEPDGSYALVGPGFNDVRSDVVNTAEEDVGYAYERCCAEGYTTPVVAQLPALRHLTRETCEFAILPPLGENTPADVIGAVRALHARGVNLMCFEKAVGFEDIFDVSGRREFARRETATGRTVFVKTPPTFVDRSTFKARYARGRDTVSAVVPAEMRAAFAYLAPAPAFKAERGTLIAAQSEHGDPVVVLSEQSRLYGDTTAYPVTFRFAVSAPGIGARRIEADAPWSVVSREPDRLVLRTKTDKDTALFFRFAK